MKYNESTIFFLQHVLLSYLFFLSHVNFLLLFLSSLLFVFLLLLLCSPFSTPLCSLIYILFPLYLYLFGSCIVPFYYLCYSWYHPLVIISSLLWCPSSYSTSVIFSSVYFFIYPPSNIIICSLVTSSYGLPVCYLQLSPPLCPRPSLTHRSLIPPPSSFPAPLFGSLVMPGRQYTHSFLIPHRTHATLGLLR